MTWDWLQVFQQWLKGMEESRRGLFFITCMFTLFVAWLLFLHHPLLNYQQNKINMTKALGDSLVMIENKIHLFESKRKYQSVKRKELQQTAAEVQQLIATSPSSSELRTLLTQAVTDQPGIQFLELNILPPDHWFQLGKINPSFPKQAAFLQRYQIRIHFVGGYLDTLNFLTLLAKKPWHLYWVSLEYKVQKYPLADVIVSFFVPAMETPS